MWRTHFLARVCILGGVLPILCIGMCSASEPAPGPTLRVGGGRAMISDDSATVDIWTDTSTRLHAESEDPVFRAAFEWGNRKWVGACASLSYVQFDLQGFDRLHRHKAASLGLAALDLGPTVRLVRMARFRAYVTPAVAYFRWGGGDLQSFHMGHREGFALSLHAGADIPLGRTGKYAINVEARKLTTSFTYRSTPDEDFPGDEATLDLAPLDLTVGMSVRFH